MCLIECWPERHAQFIVLEQNTRYCTYSFNTSGQCSIYTSSTLFAMFEWTNSVAGRHELPYFLFFRHSFPELLKDLKLPCCMGRAVINAKESDSCQTASVVALVKSSRC